MSTKKQKIIAIVFSFFLLFLPFLVSAGGLVPCGGINQNPCTVTDIFSMVALVTNWLIFVAGIYAVFQIVNAGFWMTVTMGEEENIAKWKKALTEAVVGFVLVMMAYLLINTAVNYILLDGTACNLKVDLANPLSYLNSTSYSTNPNSCPKP